ncbi:hypothetical protein ABZS82_16035 [Streptomyces albidoflavus]
MTEEIRTSTRPWPTPAHELGHTHLRIGFTTTPLFGPATATACVAEPARPLRLSGYTHFALRDADSSRPGQPAFEVLRALVARHAAADWPSALSRHLPRRIKPLRGDKSCPR